MCYKNSTMWEMRILMAVAAIAVLVAEANGQISDQAEPEFEVASIKPNVSDNAMAHFGIRGDRFAADNTTVKELITLAYNVRDLQLVGAPEWMGKERYDIVAKAYAQLKPGTPPPELKRLLVERFGLKVRHETRDLPMYALVMAREDRQFGPAAKQVEVDRCPEAAARAAERARTGQPRSPVVPGQRPSCGLFYNPGSLRGGSIGFGAMLQSLARVVGRIVIDRTGLTGKFDFDLTWAADGNPDAAGPSIFTALQEQLGLKLESTRGPVEVLVIDHVERPVPD
jgi:uncharacterized protein (TIGR03435 family)